MVSHESLAIEAAFLCSHSHRSVELFSTNSSFSGYLKHQIKILASTRAKTKAYRSTGVRKLPESPCADQDFAINYGEDSISNTHSARLRSQKSTSLPEAPVRLAEKGGEHSL